MKRTYLRLAIHLLLAGTPLARLEAATNDEVAARRIALDLAGAFSNDGFKMRDGSWMGHLAPHESRILQVNLYAGNQYWFSVGTAPSAQKIAITVHGEAGEAVPVEPFSEDGKAAAGFAPQVSGPYYLRVEDLGSAPVSFCLVYSYK